MWPWTNSLKHDFLVQLKVQADLERSGNYGDVVQCNKHAIATTELGLTPTMVLDAVDDILNPRA